MNGKHKLAGLKRLYTAAYRIKRYKGKRRPCEKKSAGVILIKSARLRDYIGQEARVIVYIKKGSEVWYE